MSTEAWIAVGGITLTIVSGFIAVYARLVRVETILGPIAKWFNEGGPLAQADYLKAVRAGAQAAVVEIIRQDREYRSSSPAEKQRGYPGRGGDEQ